MSPVLPPALAAALQTLAEGRPGRLLAQKAQAISAAYRTGAPSSMAIRDADDALAYALTRLPATYAATSRAFDALADRAPAFRPKTLLDAGCGPGGASFAAVAAFDSLGRLRLVDASATLLDLARRLAQSLTAAVETRLADLRMAELEKADLAAAAYVLTEATEADALALAAKLWAATDGALVLVEPGSPTGWARLMIVRAMLINSGAAVAAPCPHAAACPIAPPDWCHFSQRLPRLRAHRLAKGADAPFEDEKFAYLVATRRHLVLVPSAPRVLAPPRRDKSGIALKLCEPSGALGQRQVPSRDRAASRALRRAGWGDAIEG